MVPICKKQADVFVTGLGEFGLAVALSFTINEFASVKESLCPVTKPPQAMHFTQFVAALIIPKAICVLHGTYSVHQALFDTTDILLAAAK